MSISIQVSGTGYHFSDEEWRALNQGDLGAPELVLRHIIKRQHEYLLQADDEISFRNDLIATASGVVGEHRDTIAALEKERALGWQSKPAKAKREVLPI